MDPIDRLRPALDGVACTACGASVPPDRIRILARRDDLSVVELACPACGVTAIDMTTDHAAVTSADVEAMRTMLADWRGDLRGLLDAR
jgi:predicted RNA-binding Zn-ribbon protein involved in translation (DUF1610 family)